MGAAPRPRRRRRTLDSSAFVRRPSNACLAAPVTPHRTPYPARPSLHPSLHPSPHPSPHPSLHPSLHSSLQRLGRSPNGQDSRCKHAGAFPALETLECNNRKHLRANMWSERTAAALLCHSTALKCACVGVHRADPIPPVVLIVTYTECRNGFIHPPLYSCNGTNQTPRPYRKSRSVARRPVV